MRRIVLCYRKLIGHQTPGSWEQLVFGESFREYRMQVPVFDPSGNHPQFSRLLRAVPDAEKLHHRVSASVIGYLRQLDGVIPDITDSLGLRVLRFTNFHFEIINSATNDKTAHQVAVNFFSHELYWIDTIGDRLLLSPVTHPSKPFLLGLQPFLNIHHIDYGNTATRRENLPG